MKNFEFDLQRFFVISGGGGNSSGVKTIQLHSSDETIDGDLGDSIVKIYPYSSGVNKLTYAGIEYTFNNAGGNAFLMTNENGGIDFIFVDNGDSITIPEEASATTNFYYIDKSSAAYVTNPNSVEPVAVPTVPVITGSESYTVTMTTATSRRSARAEFTVSDIGAESYVAFGGYPFVFFSAAGGNFTFNQQGQVTDITAASGDVIFYNEATSFLSQVDNNDRPLLTLDGSTLYIDAVTFEYNDNTLVYNHDDKSLFGLADRSVIHDAGAITKIYAPSAQGIFKFGDDSDLQIFSAWGADGNIDNPDNRAYFTVDGDKVTGFTFAATDDQLTGNFSNITLTDAPTGNTFTAPVLTSDGNIIESTIIKTVEKINGTNKDCYAFLGQELEGVTANFADGTSVTFNAVNDYTELLFTTTGKLLTILNLSAGNEIAIDNAANSFYIDGNEIEITGGGFTYRKINARTSAIIDLKAGATVRKAVGVNQIITAAGDDGNGTFTFGNDSYEVSGNVDGVTFNLDTNGNVTSIDGINGTESVKQVGSSATVTYDNTSADKVIMASGILIGDASSRTKAITITANKLDNSIIGGSGDDVIWAGAGNDSLVGNAGNDKLNGGDGNDILDGGTGNDTLSGAAGNDSLIGGTGNDSLSGGDGNDSILGGAGTDKLLGGNGKDYLDGGTGNDNLNGGTGDDTLLGGSGKDTFTGGAGNDLFIYESGNDLITDMSATDTLQIGDGKSTYSKETVDGNIILTVGGGLITLKGAATLSKLNISGATEVVLDKTDTYDNNTASSVTLASNVKNADASSRTKAITITANKLANSIVGGSGNDVIWAGAGNDSVLGNAGADKLYGGDGNDILDGGTGNDTLSGAAGNDSLIGGTGNDSLSGGDGNDSILGGAGTDKLLGGNGKDYLDGGTGNDNLSGGAGNDTLLGGAGNDTLTGGSGNDLFIYSAGNDVITDYASGDKISLGAEISSASFDGTNALLIIGSDSLTVNNTDTLTLINADGTELTTIISSAKTYDNSAATNVTMTAGILIGDASSRTTAIKITGNALDNSIVGGTKNDTLYGKDGADTLVGGSGADKLYGGDGNDSLSGGNGNDTLSGSTGNDKLIGGSGNDSLSGGDDNDTLSGGSGNDKLLGGNGNDSLSGGDGNDTLSGGADNDKLLGGNGNDSLNGGDGNDSLSGGAGNDTLLGGAGNDTLTGGNGNDLFIYSAGNDVITDYASGDKISLGAEISSASFDGTDALLIIGSDSLTVNNTDTLTLINADGTELTTIISSAKTYDNSAATNVTMTAGILIGDASSRTTAINITGNELDNSILGGRSKDSLYGEDGNDYLVGNANNDILNGGAGDDTLWGGAGNDTLTGGDGADTFIYNAGEGKDVITDFSDDDFLEINGNFSTSYNPTENTITFKVDTISNAITLKDCTAKTIHVNDTVFFTR